MNIISTKDMLEKARTKKYAVPAFNIHNLETMQTVLEGASEKKSPIIIATTKGTIDYAGLDNLVALANVGAKNYGVPVALHLDHCTDLEFLKKCIDSGYKSVMIDASGEDFEKNINITKEAVNYAHSRGVTVEAELGTIGGEEDDIVVDEKDAMLTDPEKALEFVERTNVDSLAVAIGTAHGVYKLEPELDFERLKRMNEIISVPLVLHGASGVPSKDVKKAIENGVCKVNISTELKIPFSDALKKYLLEHPEADDMRDYMKPAKKAMKNVILEKIDMCGSGGKA